MVPGEWQRLTMHKITTVPQVKKVLVITSYSGQNSLWSKI